MMSRLLILSLFAITTLGGCVTAIDDGCTGVAGCGPDAPMTTRPTWKLRDFQPASSGFDTTYGLEAFDGKTTVVVFLAGWCGFCQSQALELEKLQQAYDAEDANVQIVAVNGPTADNEGDRNKLLYQSGTDGSPDPSTPRATFPMFQDTEAAGVWVSMGGAKDDFFIFRPDGSLSKYISARSEPLDLRNEERVTALRGYIDAAR